MPGWKLSISNIGWAAADDAAVYAAMGAAGFTGLEIAPTRIFPENPYSHLDGAALFGGWLQNRWGFVVPSLQSIWYGQTGNIFNRADHPALLAYTDAAFAFAHAVGCPSLVFGCPRNRRLPEGKEADPATLAIGEEFLDQAGTLAAHRGVRLAIEANAVTYTNYLNTTRQAFDLVKKLGNPGLAVNLDLSTILYNGERLEDYAPDLALVSHVHISEPGLAPLTPRPEHARLAALLRQAGYAGFVSIEMATTSLAHVERALQDIAEVFV